MTEHIANSLACSATHYASRHDRFYHAWVNIAGFLTGRIGNYQDSATYSRKVLDTNVEAEQIRDGRGHAGIIYHSRSRHLWVPGAHAPASPADAGRPCRYSNGVFAAAALSTTQSSYDYDMTGLCEHGKLISSDGNHPWLVYLMTMNHLQPQCLPQGFRQIRASSFDSILELIRQTVLISDCVEERPDLARRINNKLNLVEANPVRVEGTEFKHCILIMICCTGLANIGGMNATALFCLAFIGNLNGTSSLIQPGTMDM